MTLLIDKEYDMSSPEEFPDDWRSHEGNPPNDKGDPPNDKEQPGDFHFLCHNADDKPAVRQVAALLRKRGLVPILDVGDFPPGQYWLITFGPLVGRAKSVAFFIGPNGIGVSQNIEIQAFIGELTKRQLPIIPVFLPGSDISQLPVYLIGRTWVDLRSLDEEGIDQLVWGMTGRRPEDLNGDD
jgi:hypothetical protein